MSDQVDGKVPCKIGLGLSPRHYGAGLYALYCKYLWVLICYRNRLFFQFCHLFDFLDQGRFASISARQPI